MTVKQLIAHLKQMPPDAEVVYPNMEIDQKEPIGTVTLMVHGDWKQVVLR